MKKIIAIFGMPRSGTSFVGQIFDSHPNTVFRMEPLFAYKLKNMIDENSTKEEYINFFKKAYESDEDFFMNQMDKREKGSYPTFNKLGKDTLVIKTTRFHEILPTLLKYFNKDILHVISIVRHPCGSINSWLKHPNEFPQHLNYRDEWRHAKCRQTAKEEYWGFEDWKLVYLQHIKLEKEFNNFKIFQYEDIVNSIYQKTEELFKFCEINIEEQTKQFLKECQSKNLDDPYAVYKNKSVISKWKYQLDIEIQKEIINEIINTELEKFLIE